MSELDELKELMDTAEAKAKGCENAWRKANADFIKARDAYEKERDKDKSCESCQYSIVLDFSADGWHNLCGNSNAPCTCCNSKCMYYKPDNIITGAIKEYFNSKDKLLPTITQTIKEMGFTVTAEGIENQEMATEMKNIGCDYLQGFFISKPLPASEFISMYAQAV